MPDIYPMMKYQRSNQSTCYNQKPIVRPGEHVKVGDVLADGPACDMGEIALGRNVVVAFMPWQGYNFEDSILVSERIVKDDVFTTVHIEEFECIARDTKLGKEEVTSDIPNVGEEALKDLDDAGVVRIGAEVKPGDILVGKITPKGESQLSPEEKLLRAIFGEKAGDVRDSSLKVPAGRHAASSSTRGSSRARARRRTSARRPSKIRSARELERTRDEEVKILRDSFFRKIRESSAARRPTAQARRRQGQGALEKGVKLNDDAPRRGRRASTGAKSRSPRAAKQVGQLLSELEEIVRGSRGALPREDRSPVEGRRAAAGRHQDGEGLHRHQEEAPGRRQDGRSSRQQGCGLAHPAGRRHAVPRRRHPVDIVLNPLGVPSRMNVGQILETHLGWGAEGSRRGGRIGECSTNEIASRRRSIGHLRPRQPTSKLREGPARRRSSTRSRRSCRRASTSRRRCSTAPRRSRSSRC